MNVHEAEQTRANSFWSQWNASPIGAFQVGSMREHRGWCPDCWRELGPQESGGCWTCTTHRSFEREIDTLIRDFVGQRSVSVDNLFVCQNILMELVGGHYRREHGAPSSLTTIVFGHEIGNAFRHAVVATWHRGRWIRFDLAEQYAPDFYTAKAKLDEVIAGWRESGRAECRDATARSEKQHAAHAEWMSGAIDRITTGIGKPSATKERIHRTTWITNGRSVCR